MLTWILLIVGGYVIGSIPFGVLIARTQGVDITSRGSGNIGATNVGRVLGRRFGVLCFLFDFLKGAMPVLLAGFISGAIHRDIPDIATNTMWAWLAVAAASIAGHMASVFLGFRGGKGVATSFGALAAMWPLLTWPAVGAGVTWFLAVRLSRIVSLSSMIAAVSIPIWYLLVLSRGEFRDLQARLGPASPPLIVTTLLAALVIWRHRANIGRLARGEEPKLKRRA